MARTADRQPRPSAPKRHAGTAAPRPAEANSPADGILRLQRTVGNAAVQRLLAQRSASGAPGSVSPEVEEGIAGSRGGGAALDSSVRGEMETAFGADFGGVRVHTGGAADTLNRALGARAFTTGADVFFRSGEFSPSSPGGKRLLAHELAHVVQQGGSSAPVQRSSLALGPPDDAYEREAEAAADAVAGSSSAASLPTAGAAGVQRQEAEGAAAAPAAPRATPLDAAVYFMNPGLETDPGIRAALDLLARYAPEVKVEDVDFRLFEGERESHLGMEEGGRSFWDGRTPVIELVQEDLDTLEAHGRDPASVSVADVYNVIRTVGHEMHHLWRAKRGHASNPVQPLWQAEGDRRMGEVRRNWLDHLQDNPRERRDLGIPAGATLNRWEDIPEAARREIEEGAASTSYIQGLYQRSAYLVEEIYTKVEEVAYLRAMQHDPRAAAASRAEVAALARLVYRLSNLMDSFASGGELLTPALVAQARTQMLAYLRARYPNRADASYDSYEVIFYLSAIHGGMAPIYDEGRLVSRAPPGARVP